jgi:hypothetical protein
MIVVSDTSPLSNLALVDSLFLLREIYNTVVIPQAVAEELSNEQDEDQQIAAVLSLDWIEVRQATNLELIAGLRNDSLSELLSDYVHWRSLCVRKAALQELARITLPFNGILVDDEGHPSDIISHVHDVLKIIWDERDSDIEQEACEILKVSTLRDYFRKPAVFFNNHLSRYSKSRLDKWQKKLKETWGKLEKGDYDWAHLAHSIWTERVREKCWKDKSLAIAHGLEDLYEPPPEMPKRTKRKKKE